ncbi:MAG TPA: hypothetical protein VD973_18100 [Symbiobacteriaceae bacterium]|jgi:O-antigen/teichoic acid export membrane protein|nr:hypothetical protein [Symbiobacteriaceae bacterium]
MATQLLFYPVIARVFGFEALGRLMVLVGVLNIIGVGFGSAGAMAYLRRFRSGDCNWNSRIFAGGCSFVVLAGLAGILAFTSYGITGVPKFLLAAACSVMALRIYTAAWYRGVLKFWRVAVSNIVLGCGYGFAALWVDVLPIELWILIAEGLSLSILFPLRGFSQLDLVGGNSATMRVAVNAMWRDVIPFLLISVVGNLYAYAGRFLADYFLTVRDIAVLAAGTSFARVLALPLSGLSSVLLSHLAQRSAPSTRLIRRVLTVALGSTVAIIPVSIAAGMVFLAFAYPDIARVTQPVLLVSALGVGFSVFDALVRGVLYRWAGTSQRFISDVVGVAILFALGYLLGQTWGVVGLAWASTFALLVRGGWTLVGLLRLRDHAPSVGAPEGLQTE